MSGGESPAYFQPRSRRGVTGPQTPGPEGKPRRAPGPEGGGWAAAAGRTPARRRGPAPRVARGQGWAAERTEAAEASAGARHGGLGGLRRPQPGCGTAEPRSGLTDAGRGPPAASATARGRGGLSLPLLPSLPASPSEPGFQPPGGSRALRAAPGARAGQRAQAPPPPSAAEAAQGRPAGATARGGSAARASSPRPRPPAAAGPAPGPAPPTAPPELRNCGPGMAPARRAASRGAGS